MRGIRLDRLEKSAKELSDLTGQRCIPAQADVRQPKQLQEAAAKTIEAFGRIDFVICGAQRSLEDFAKSITYTEVM